MSMGHWRQKSGPGEFLSGGAAIFFNAGEDLVAAGAHEHAGTRRDGQACVALGCERTEAERGTRSPARART